jgi:hypothetical protein
MLLRLSRSRITRFVLFLVFMLTAQYYFNTSIALADDNGPVNDPEIEMLPGIRIVSPKWWRIGLAMGYTRFKNIDGMTYTLAGVAFMHRIISYGYLDLTIMTSLNSEKVFESGISGDETTFGRAVSYSINYFHSVPLDNNFSLLIGIGFERLVVDLKLDDSWDKLTKNSLLLGGGLEYNYQRFFVQANLCAVIGEDKNLRDVIGEDKNLGHDINATIKTGINF